MSMFNDTVLDHFTNPRNVGDIEDADGTGTYGSPVCGDIMRISIKVDGEKITDAKFKTFGCGSAIASSSMATEMIKGRTIEEALQLTNKQIVEELGGLPGPKVHCSILADYAIKLAIHDYAKKQGKEYAGLAKFNPNGEDPHGGAACQDREGGCPGSKCS